jgi:hypothetical protein
MYNDHAINDPVIDAAITYNTGGVLQIDVSNNVEILSNLVVSNTNKTAHINDETAVIYDNQSGVSLSLITKDTNSSTFLKMTTEQMNGLAISGGNILDGKSGGSLGWTNGNGQYTTTQMIVGGSNPLKYNSTVGINTYSPMVDQYVFDLNGPMHVNNGQVTKIATVSYQINSLFGNGMKIYAAGSPKNFSKPYFYDSLYSSNGGNQFNTIAISNVSNDTITNKSNPFRCGTAYNSQIAFIAGDNGYIYYKNDQNNWNLVTFFGEPTTRLSTNALYSTTSPYNNGSGYIRLFRTISNSNIVYVYDLLITNIQNNIKELLGKSPVDIREKVRQEKLLEINKTIYEYLCSLKNFLYTTIF